MTDKDPERLRDRREIEAALLRYVRGVDRCNWALVRSAYHPDAHDDHGNYKGGIDGFIASLELRHQNIEQSMHVVSNITIEFDSPDGAVSESYFVTHQRHAAAAGPARLNYLPAGTGIADDQPVEVQAVGRYVDRFTRRDGVWRIQERAVVFESYSGWAVASDAGLKSNWTVSRRDGQDPIELLRARVGLPKQE